MTTRMKRRLLSWAEFDQACEIGTCGQYRDCRLLSYVGWRAVNAPDLGCSKNGLSWPITLRSM